MVYFLYLNYIQLVFFATIIGVVLFGSLVNLFENYLPSYIVQSVRYGKFADKKEKSMLVVQVPKSWFRHFYIYAAVLFSGVFYMCINNYIYHKPPPEWVYNVLDYSMGYLRKPTVNPTRTLLVVSLLTLQCLRRFYETNFVCVFGKNARMHFVHYVLGLQHYTGCALVILGGASHFTKPYGENPVLQWTDLNMKDLCATYTFLWAWWHQYRANIILANLRKDDRGNVITESYKIPQGDWFDYITSPLNFAEIMMYTCLTFMLWPNITWWFIYAWVVSNQVETALLSHWWYVEKFENYPKKRKILFPCIY